MNKSRKPRKTASKRMPQSSVPETPPEPQVSTGLPPEESPGLQPQALTGMGNNAQFVSQSVPAQLRPGQRVTVSVTMKNTGTTTWTRAGEYKLGTQNPQDNTLWTGSPRVYLSASEAIAPGQQKTFTFEIIVPTTPGTRNFQWRMVQDGVEWFGGFTPNVPINIAAPALVNNAQFVSQSVPAQLQPGQRATVSVTMKNTGSTTWTRAGEYKLGTQNPQDNTFWTGQTRVYLSPSEAIAPGQQKTFTFEITAPSSPGTRDFQWRMVQDGVEWFGGFTPNVTISIVPVPSPVIGSQFVSQSGVPSTLQPGQKATVTITMKNTGSTTWTPGGEYKLGTQNPQDNTLWTGSPRVYLSPSEAIAPGQQKTFTFEITAPSQPGNFNFQWRMVQDGVEWFGDLTPNVAITVVPVPSLINGSQFVSQSGVPSTLQPVQKATVTITMKNTGSTTWTRAGEYKLGTQNPQDNTLWTGSPRIYLPETDAVAPGQEKSFEFEIVAPSTPGDYNFQWRMVQDGVEWFGDLTPNVTISVVGVPSQVNAAQFVSQSGVPSTMQPGQTATVSVTLENTGTTPWTAGGEYKLGSQNPQDNDFWTGSPRVYLSPSDSIAPGQQKTFTFDITAPSSPITRDFQWRMVQDGVEWFGDFTPNVQITVGGSTLVNGAQFVSQSEVPSTMQPGQKATVAITMMNTGTIPWDPNENYFLGSQNKENNWDWGLNRVPPNGLVAPGEQETFTFTITAPSKFDDVNFQWQMLREGVEWFGESTPNVAIKVTHESEDEQPDNTRFGVVGHPSLGFEPRNVELLQTLGVGWVRAAFDWDEMEPQKGNIQWETAEKLVKALTDRKLKIYWDFSYAPGWANGGRSHNYPPLDQQDLYDFVKAVVTRFKDDVDCWATWNEPNLSGFYKGSLGRYVDNELQTTLRAIKDAHPEAKIAVGELFHDQSYWGYKYWLKPMLSKAKGRFDVISHHIYGKSANCGNQTESVVRLASRLKEWGYGDYPIWITEAGLDKTQSEQSNYLVCFYDSMKRVSQWEKTFWYRFGHETVGQHGLLDGNEQPTQTYYTYQRYILENQGPVNGAQVATQSDILTGMRASE